MKGKKKNTGLKKKAAGDQLPAKTIDELEAKEPYHKGIDKNRILELRLKGLTFQDIGDLVGCSRQNVSQIIKKNFPNLDSLNSYKENKDMVFEAKQQEMMYSLDKEKIEKMSGRDAVVSAGILEDKIRLIRGQATENINIHAEIRKADELQERLKQLKEELNIMDEGEEDDLTNGITN